jgi:hypothetical protein
LAAGWGNMLNHQLPALLPLDSFWNALPEIFQWLFAAVAPVAQPTFPIGGGDIIRERVVVVPDGAGSLTHVEIIRFAASNRLVVEIDYRDAEGNRSNRAIEAYSLRRTQAGAVLLMAVQESDGQARSFRLDRILGVTATQRTFAPRYPIELTAAGPQSIPASTRSTGATFSIPHVATRRTAPGRVPASGPTYVFRCSVCHRQFERKTYDGGLRAHKNKAGRDCYGRTGLYVRTKHN